MKHNVMSLLLMFTICANVLAQTSLVKIKVFSADNKEPLMGATVFFKNLNKGAITDFDGLATFTDIPNGLQSIEISYLGFKTVEISISLPAKEPLRFYLAQDENMLDEVIVQSSRSTRTIKRIPTRVEHIGIEELGEKAIMNPANISMVLRESTGIQMQQTSLSSGNSNIRIQGLDGRYTQLLRDGFPLYGGFSSGLSIMQIPPLDLQQFEIIKGSSSTLYGGGAIAGLVNMVSKTPQEGPKLDIMLTQTHAGGSTANTFYSKRDNKFGVTLYGSGHYQKAYDVENDDFSNLPKTKSISFNPKFFYYPSEKSTFWVGLNATYDDREGGDMEKVENGENGIHQYTEKNVSKRLSSQVVYNKQIDSANSFQVKNSISFFDRNLEVPSLVFSGKQTNIFTEASYTKKDLVLGANLYIVNFDEDADSTLQRDQKDITFGFFANSIFDLNENLILETGIRADFAVDWGFFALPRISLLYKNDDGFSSRIGGGLGYKIPDIFIEEAEFINFNKVLGINKNAIKAEKSYGANLDFNYQTKIVENLGISINQLFYVTAIKNGLLLSETSNGQFAFKNANATILGKGSETNIKFSFKNFRWFLNYALIDTKLNYLPGNPQKPLTAKHNAGSVLMYESDKWRIGYETYYTGKQLLFDNSKSTDFLTMGFLMMRNFDWGGAFVNFENFTNKIQSRYSPLVLPPHESPTFPEIYAPTDGFIFSLGIIIKPFGNTHH